MIIFLQNGTFYVNKNRGWNQKFGFPSDEKLEKFLKHKTVVA